MWKTVPAWDAYTPKRTSSWVQLLVFLRYPLTNTRIRNYWDTEGRRHDPREWSPLHESGKVVSYLKNEGNVRDEETFLHYGRHEFLPIGSPFFGRLYGGKISISIKTSLWTACSSVRMPSKMLKAESARYYFAL